MERVEWLDWRYWMSVRYESPNVVMAIDCTEISERGLLGPRPGYVTWDAVLYRTNSDGSTTRLGSRSGYTHVLSPTIRTFHNIRNVGTIYAYINLYGGDSGLIASRRVYM